MNTITKKLDLEVVKKFIENQTPETKIYIGTDSECYKLDGQRWAEFSTVVVVHINGNRGCKIFGQIERERVYDDRKDRPAMRLMSEVYKTAQMYLDLNDILEDRHVEIHIDVNKDKMHGSSCVVDQAIGYIRGVCNVIPLVKPDAWAASFGADRYSEIHSLHKKAESA